MASRRKQRMKLHDRDGVTVLDLGAIEIWDGADLSLLRDTLTALIEHEGCRSIGVDMSSVKYIPSGFFGMLFDWHERDIEMRLYSPQPNVANMLWFRRFFEPEGEGAYVLTSEPARDLTPVGNNWHDGSRWDDDDEYTAKPVAAAGRNR
ncbi:MAG TPA: STAS domain-containing protein [Planctomycetaceae bacterium]|nr:STAS domain-containing protein [Planctomycetaceae bacterium]